MNSNSNIMRLARATFSVRLKPGEFLRSLWSVDFARSEKLYRSQTMQSTAHSDFKDSPGQSHIYILGISCFYHDSAAVLIKDGELVAAGQEERFTRKKHDDSFPARAIAYCLKEAGLTPADLAYVGFYDKTLLKFE